MINFEILRWKNFLSTGNIFTEINLNTHNNTLIVGENGAGKSTILDALTFVLFGKPFRKINKPQLLNSINQKQLVAEIEFSIGKNNYKIVRGIKPVVFEVYMNGNLLNQSAEMKDYQEILEKQILKMNYKSFCQVVVLGSASFVPFMQLSAGQRREIIEDLLDLQIFTTMNSLLKTKVMDNSEKISSMNSERKIIESKIELTKKHMLEIQNNNENIINEKKIIIKETIENINKLTEKYDELNIVVERLQNKVEDNDKITKKINQLSKLRHQIEAKIAVLNKDIDFFKKHENCPTCRQPIEEEFRNKQINEKEENINETEIGLKKLVEEYESADNKLSQIMKINHEIRSNEMELIKIKTNIQSLEKYNKQLKSDISQIKEKYTNDGDNKIVEFEKSFKKIESNLKELNEEKNLLSAAAVMLKDGGIKAKIIKQYVPIINKLINKYLSAMDFFVQFELDEEFNETIKSRYRDEFSYASFSEGEKMRINLAVLFTWRAIAKLRNSVSTNLLILDEVMDSSLDSNGTEEFLKILNNLTSDTNTFIISHKTDQLYDKFEKIIKFEKFKNFSRIAT